MTLNSAVISILALFYCLGLSHRAKAGEFTLEQAIQSAVEQNPELGAERSRVEVAHALKTSSPSLPPPMIFAGAMGMSPLKASGQMENSIGISQTIPFPTKLTSELKEKRFDTQAAEVKLQARILDLTSTVKASFYDLYGVRKKINLLKEKKAIFEEHYKRLRASALSDRIVQAHRVWVQTEIDLIENDLIGAHEDERVSRGRLNIVMGHSPEQELSELKEPTVSDLPTELSISSSHPALQSSELSQHALDAAVTGAKSLWLPDLSIQYRNARRFDHLMPNYSEVTVGITLPFLFFWTPQGQTQAANARARAASFEVEKVRQDLKMEFLESNARSKSLKAQLKNYETKIIPQAEKRMKIAHGLVPSDMASLSEHRDAMESLVNLKLAQLSIRVDYEKSIAKLESLLSNGNEKRN